MSAHTLAALACALAAGCAHTARSALPQEPGITLVVQNATSTQLQIYFIEQQVHTRIGEVAPSSEGRVFVRQALLGARTWFRIYAFRGIEPCPVARVIDISLSRTPRLIVTDSDVSANGELLGDACRPRASSELPGSSPSH